MASPARVSLPNPALLAWARESAGYSLLDLAQRMKRPPDVLSEWESGAAAPTFRQLADLARHCHRSVAALYLPAPPVEPDLPTDLRCLPEAERQPYSPKARLAFRRLRNSLEAWAEITAIDGACARVDLPALALGGDTEVAARALRDSLGVSLPAQTACRDQYAHLDLWREALFARGVLVQMLDVDTIELRGFSMLHAGLAGIGLSTRDVPPARLFTMLHETAHIALGRVGVGGDTTASREIAASATARVERFCDAVAGSVLLPISASGVAAALATIGADLDPSAVDRAARRFGVSRYVVARRMLDLRMVDRERYWDAVERWRAEPQSRRSPGGGDFYTNRLSEAGRPFAGAVLAALDRDVISSGEAASALRLRSPDMLVELRELLAGRPGD